jgi:LacI family transcriptional regulator
MEKSLKKVAVAVHGAQSAHRELIRGVHRYAIEHQLKWRFPRPDTRRGSFDILPEQMRSLPLDGIIGIFWKANEIADFKKRGIACVNVFSHTTDGSTPVVASDDFEIGFSVGQHFISQNIRRVYYYGPRTHDGTRSPNGVRPPNVGELRYRGLAAAVAASGLPPVIDLPFLANDDKSSSVLFGKALKVLLSDPIGPTHQPGGVMLFSDGLVDECMETCLDAGIRIPEQLSVVGVDNENILCNMMRPSLSSVPQNAEEIGYLAAEQLARLFAGKAPAAKPLLVHPQAIHVRQSSDLLAVDDPVVSQALGIIRDRAGQNIGVSDLLKAVPMARRTLEGRFMKTLGFSPYEAILRSRIARAKDLLSTTGKTVEAVAIECGFNSLTRFTLVFRRITGCPPGEWRKSSQSTAQRSSDILPFRR